MRAAPPSGRPRERRDGDLVRSPHRAAIAGLAMFAVAALLTAVVAVDAVTPPFLQDVDDAWRRAALGWPSVVERAGEVLEAIGAGLVMVPFRIAVAIWLLWRRRRWDLAAWLLGWALADVLSAILKPGLGRERPIATDPGNPFTSFPSAHAKTAAQVAVGLVLVATSPWRPRRLAWAAAITWIALMAVSRIAVDHHWFSDVAAGSLIGAGSALVVASAVQRARDDRPARDS
jgi:membrane-associated phospholipid phosphatase